MDNHHHHHHHQRGIEGEGGGRGGPHSSTSSSSSRNSHSNTYPQGLTSSKSISSIVHKKLTTAIKEEILYLVKRYRISRETATAIIVHSLTTTTTPSISAFATMSPSDDLVHPSDDSFTHDPSLLPNSSSFPSSSSSSSSSSLPLSFAQVSLLDDNTPSTSEPNYHHHHHHHHRHPAPPHQRTVIINSSPPSSFSSSTLPMSSNNDSNGRNIPPYAVNSRSYQHSSSFLPSSTTSSRSSLYYPSGYPPRTTLPTPYVNDYQDTLVHVTPIYDDDDDRSSQISTSSSTYNPNHHDNNTSCNMSYTSTDSEEEEQRRMDYLCRVHGLSYKDADRVLLLSDVIKQQQIQATASLPSSSSLSFTVPTQRRKNNGDRINNPPSSSGTESSVHTTIQHLVPKLPPQDNNLQILQSIDRLCDKVKMLRPRLGTSNSSSNNGSNGNHGNSSSPHNGKHTGISKRRKVESTSSTTTNNDNPTKETVVSGSSSSRGSNAPVVAGRTDTTIDTLRMIEDMDEQRIIYDSLRSTTTSSNVSVSDNDEDHAYPNNNYPHHPIVVTSTTISPLPASSENTHQGSVLGKRTYPTDDNTVIQTSIPSNHDSMLAFHTTTTTTTDGIHNTGTNVANVSLPLTILSSSSSSSNSSLPSLIPVPKVNLSSTTTTSSSSSTTIVSSFVSSLTASTVTVPSLPSAVTVLHDTKRNKIEAE